MTDLEQRLRIQLPSLAEALVEAHAAPEEEAKVIETSVTWGWRPSWDSPLPLGGRRLLVGATLAAAALATVAVWPESRPAVDTAAAPSLTTLPNTAPTNPPPGSTSFPDRTQIAEHDPPTGVVAEWVDGVNSATLAGVWESLPSAPIPPRSGAITGWTGSEALFWSGGMLTDGAAFAAETRKWRLLTTPQWTHPGLTGMYSDGYLYGLAKGGGSRFPVDATGPEQQMALVHDMLLTAAVEADGTLWGLGAGLATSPADPYLALARYQPDSNSWRYATGYADSGVQIGFGPDQEVTWTGREIVVWGTNRGVAVNPTLALSAATDVAPWRTVILPSPPKELGAARIVESALISGVDEVAVLVLVEQDGQRHVDIVVEIAPSQWRWLFLGFPVDDLRSVTPAVAGDHILLFDMAGTRYVFDLDGHWHQQTLDSTDGAEAPNAVWTGDELVVLGVSVNDDGAVAVGAGAAAWTPPT